MNKIHRKKSKLRWFSLAKKLVLKIVLIQSHSSGKSYRKRRVRKKRRYYEREPWLQRLKQSWFQLWSNKKRRRRKRRKSLSQRTQIFWQRLTQSIIQDCQQLFLVKKRRRRKGKQYAVYVMSNQKKVD